MKSTSRLLVIILILKVVDEVQCLEIQPSKCSIYLKGGFGIPSPVFIYNNNNNYMLPDIGKGTVTLLGGDKVIVACPGNEVKLGEQLQGVEVKLECQSGATFIQVDGSWRGELNTVSCSGESSVTVTPENEGLQCGGQGRDSGKMVTVGYTVSSVSTKPHKLYEACFNSATKRTLYVKHELPPSSFYTQNKDCDTKKRKFIASRLFGNLPVNTCYLKNTQQLETNTLHEYVSKTEYFTRGHLAPCADFPLRALQRATFQYVNAAPQWKSVNGGDWNQLEEALRLHVKNTGQSLTVYTGTHGQLSGSPGGPGLYLTDENNNNVIPVPLYFYKVVYHEATKKATVFITINYSTTDIYRIRNDPHDVKFCGDVCNQITWLTWGSERSFCCSYGEFFETVDHKLGLIVLGLYIKAPAPVVTPRWRPRPHSRRQGRRGNQ